MYSVRYRNIANMDEDRANATMLAPANAGRRNSVRSSIGLASRRSASTKATSSTLEPIR